MGAVKGVTWGSDGCYMGAVTVTWGRDAPAALGEVREISANKPRPAGQAARDGPVGRRTWRRLRHEHLLRESSPQERHSEHRPPQPHPRQPLEVDRIEF
jgi:hypothetical protein